MQDDELARLSSIPLKGFRVASDRARLVEAMRFLETTLHEDKLRLAAYGGKL